MIFKKIIIRLFFWGWHFAKNKILSSDINVNDAKVKRGS